MAVHVPQSPQKKKGPMDPQQIEAEIGHFGGPSGPNRAPIPASGPDFGRILVGKASTSALRPARF